MTEDRIAETKRGEFKVIEGSGLRTEMDTHTRQQEMPRVHKRRLEHHAPTNRYPKYCRHTTLNICVSPVSCRYSSATGGTDLPTHLAIFAICISTVLLQLLAWLLYILKLVVLFLAPGKVYSSNLRSKALEIWEANFQALQKSTRVPVRMYQVWPMPQVEVPQNWSSQ